MSGPASCQMWAWRRQTSLSGPCGKTDQGRREARSLKIEQKGCAWVIESSVERTEHIYCTSATPNVETVVTMSCAWTWGRRPGKRGVREGDASGNLTASAGLSKSQPGLRCHASTPLHGGTQQACVRSNPPLRCETIRGPCSFTRVSRTDSGGPIQSAPDRNRQPVSSPPVTPRMLQVERTVAKRRLSPECKLSVVVLKGSVVSTLEVVHCSCPKKSMSGVST